MRIEIWYECHAITGKPTAYTYIGFKCYSASRDTFELAKEALIRTVKMVFDPVVKIPPPEEVEI